MTTTTMTTSSEGRAITQLGALSGEASFCGGVPLGGIGPKGLVQCTYTRCLQPLRCELEAAVGWLFRAESEPAV
jgi:hypothetical protein